MRSAVAAWRRMARAGCRRLCVYRLLEELLGGAERPHLGPPVADLLDGDSIELRVLRVPRPVVAQDGAYLSRGFARSRAIGEPDHVARHDPNLPACLATQSAGLRGSSVDGLAPSLPPGAGTACHHVVSSSLSAFQCHEETVTATRAVARAGYDGPALPSPCRRCSLLAAQTRMPPGPPALPTAPPSRLAPDCHEIRHPAVSGASESGRPAPVGRLTRWAALTFGAWAIRRLLARRRNRTRTARA